MCFSGLDGNIRTHTHTIFLVNQDIFLHGGSISQACICVSSPKIIHKPDDVNVCVTLTMSVKVESRKIKPSSVPSS